MYGPLKLGQANALMPRMGQTQQEMQMGAQQGVLAPQFGGTGAAPSRLVSGPGVGGFVGAPISFGAGGFAPQMAQRFVPPMMSMPSRTAPVPGMPGGPSAVGGGWISSPFFRGMGGMLGGAQAAVPRFGGLVGAPTQQPNFGRPTMGIPEQPNMPGMPQQLGPAYGRGRFGGGGFR